MITHFAGDNWFLSNFHPAPVVLDTVVYPTVEHAYQAAKFENRTMSGVKSKTGEPLTMRQLIFASPTPGIAKRYGRWNGIRRDWEQIKLKVMRDLVYQKFTTHQILADKLRATGAAELVEGNHWGDKFWGQCPIGTGSNHLGRILMEVRRDIQ